MGFSPMGGGISKRPMAAGQNSIQSGDAAAQALILRANSTVDPDVNVFAITDGSGYGLTGVGPTGSHFQSSTEWQGAIHRFSHFSEAFSRIVMHYHNLGGPALHFGDGATDVDTYLTRLAPVGVSDTGTFAQDGRRLDSRGVFNIRDFGAVGNGSTDDRAAIQAAIDAVPSTGGVVYFPSGDYGVNCTTVGVVLPFGKHITLVGEAMPTTVAQGGTRIKRLAGNTALVTTDPAWTRTDASCKVSMRCLEWNGNGTTSYVAYLKGLGQTFYQGVRFTGQSSSSTLFAADRPGVELIRPWNVRFSDCDFNVLGGTDSNAHAVRIGPILAANGGQSGDNANTVHFVGCEWETNRGSDVRITGEGANLSAHINFVGGKWECGGTAASGNGTTIAARTAPQISLGLHNNVHFVGIPYFLPSTANAPLVRVDNVGSLATTFNGCSFDGPSGQPLIDQNGGGVSCTGCFFGNWNATTAWDIAAAVGAGKAQGAGNLYYNATQANRYVDARVSPTGPTNQP